MAKKVKVKLKTGATIEIYEHEKYRLWKKGLVEVTKKEAEKYTEKQENEPKEKFKKALQGSQNDRLDKRLEKLENKGVGDGSYDDTELSGKVNDLTEKVEGLSNYDDTELKEQLATLKSDNETLLTQIGELETRIVALEPKK